MNLRTHVIMAVCFALALAACGGGGEEPPAGGGEEGPAVVNLLAETRRSAKTSLERVSRMSREDTPAPNAIRSERAARSAFLHF